jgi:hypothetical protein
MQQFSVLTAVVLLHTVLVNFPTEAVVAKHCDPRACQLPSCRCSNTEIPGGVPVRDAPQFVVLTFDDAVTQINSEFYKQAFDNRINPDGCPVIATYFVSHEYTDYTKVSGETLTSAVLGHLAFIPSEIRFFQPLTHGMGKFNARNSILYYPLSRFFCSTNLFFNHKRLLPEICDNLYYFPGRCVYSILWEKS